MDATPTRKSRAAYLRAYRARKATPASPHTCPQCHTAFSVDRDDAVYCTDACRARAWRLITHRAVQHQPEGWVIPANRADAGAREWCTFELKEPGRHFCGRPATWLGTSYQNHQRLTLLTYRCDEHCSQEMRAAVCDPEASCHAGARCPAQS